MAVCLNALIEDRKQEERKLLVKSVTSIPVDVVKGNLIVRKLYSSSSLKSIYQGEPFNFTPLRPVPLGFSSLDRAARECPWESRLDILKRRIVPKFMMENVGTPRRDYQGGMVEGIRIRKTFNPYFLPNNQKLKQWNSWSSRDYRNWDPVTISVRGGFKKYEIPQDIRPTKDELGKSHPPILSARLAADVEKQYHIHGLPWVFGKDFLLPRPHFRDKEPMGLKHWNKRETRQAKIDEAMKNMDSLTREYYKEKRIKKANTWFEKLVLEMAGEQVAGSFIRKQRNTK